ncbi:MAG TPA: cytochrome c biogenesis protein CcdA [Acidimicrobiales bacterium]
MPAAISADPVGVLIAFGAGILSFLSPCVLPLVPGYLSMVSGLSAAELTAVHPGGTGTVVASTTRPMLRGIGLFIGGFTLVFVALGATASGIGHLLSSHQLVLSRVSGFVIVFLGLVLILGAVPGSFWSRIGTRPLGLLTRLTGDRRFDVRPSTLGTWAAPVMGMAFAFAWTPCIGPVLGVVLGLASHNGTLAGGVLLLFAYSLGLAVPFVVTGLAFGRMTSLLARARRAMWIIEIVAGVIVVAFGVLLITNNVAWVATEMRHLFTDIGLGRLSTS